MKTSAPLSFCLLATLGGCGFGLTYSLDKGDSGATPDTTESDADTDADSDTDADTDADSDSDVDALRVDSVSPAYGTTAGGTSVVITGGPFDETASVRFGGVRADLDSVSGNEILARVPEYQTPGSVDVAVSTDTATGTLTSGFYYIQDAAGLAGVIGSIEWWDMVGSYWSTPADWGYSSFTFIDPAAFEYWEFYSSALDTCSSEFSFSGDLYVEPFGGDIPASASLTMPTGSKLRYAWDEAYFAYDAGELVNTEYQQSSSYDLDTLAPADFPSFDAPDIVRTPSSFTVTSPEINLSQPPTVSRSTFNLAWNGSGGDYVLVYLSMRNAASTTSEELVSCAVRDDGSFTVPSSVWSGWAADRLIDIQIGRVTTGTGVVPYNNADSQFVGIWWVYGAAFTR